MVGFCRVVLIFEISLVFFVFGRDSFYQIH